MKKIWKFCRGVDKVASVSTDERINTETIINICIFVYVSCLVSWSLNFYHVVVVVIVVDSWLRQG